MSVPQFLTRCEAAALLEVKPETVSTYCARGTLRGVKQGRAWLVEAASVEAMRQQRAAPPVRVDPGIEKLCRRCGEVQPLSQFVPNKRYRDGYASWCKDCHLEYNRQPGQKAKQHRKYLERYADPEYRAEYRERSNAGYRDRWRRDPAFRKRKNDRKSMFNHGRRSQKRRGDLTPEQWQAICNHYGNKCLRCGAPEVTLDHIRPLSRGGEHTAANVQPLCQSCNSSKMTKTIDYRSDKGRGVYRQEKLF
jgi:5-methylcytosine-specific restriction endonuclease McrA